MGKEQSIGQGSQNLPARLPEDALKPTIMPIADGKSAQGMLAESLQGEAGVTTTRPKLEDGNVVRSKIPAGNLATKDTSITGISNGVVQSLPEISTKGLPLNHADLISGIDDFPKSQTPDQPSIHLATQITEATLISPAGAGTNSAEAITKSANQDSSDPAEVARLVAQRDPEAFAQLYEDNLDAVYRLIYFKVGSEELAEDLTADVFLKSWEGFDRFQWRNIPFEHWLKRIARNTVIDHWRKYRHQMSSIDEHRDEVSDALAPEGWVAHEQEVEKLSAALIKLSDDQKDVIISRFIEGKSHAETSAILGKSEVYVRQIQVRALQKLRKILQDQH